jgi:CrcB protein
VSGGVLALLVAVSGGLGAVARFVVNETLRARLTTTIPWATNVINLSGSLLLGFVFGLAAGGVLPEEWRLVAGTGFLGGYTTFSTAMVETAELVTRRAWGAALVNSVAVLLVATGCAAVGYALGIAL